MSSSDSIHASVAPSILPSEAPEFSILDARGTLKIPLTTSGAIQNPPIDVPAVHVEACQHLPVAPIETAHRALAPAAGTMRSGCEATLIGGQSVSAVEFVCDAASIHSEDRVASPVTEVDRVKTLTAVNKESLATW